MVDFIEELLGTLDLDGKDLIALGQSIRNETPRQMLEVQYGRESDLFGPHRLDLMRAI
jgi:hypothetical protein